ncbi:hypothetical protein [Phyllobacterium endophyticum]|uniref:hypothetical protein n=1 Tax=Phyllobacterium endophyticum TaxID=1149773 RepID=UPI0011C996F7|nr:hypothetical protein [Phyllobacterium endophyticum]TXR47702.1 hypothetical protein FVA77_18095 [Phyllobacterium endophyticum]
MGFSVKAGLFSAVEVAICAAGSSLWPTPTKSRYCNRVEIMLQSDALKFRNDPSQSGSQIAIGNVARLWTHMWLLMKACGATPAKAYRPLRTPSISV